MGVRWNTLPKDVGLKFARKTKVVSKARANGSQEMHQYIQDKLEDYCNHNDIMFIHIPDNLMKFLFSPPLASCLAHNKMLYIWLKRVQKDVSKYLLGLPDLLLIDNAKGVEIKTGAAKPRKGQKKFAEKVHVDIVRTVDEGIEILKKKG